MLKKLLLAAGAVCLFFALIPAVLYGIFNTGVWALAVIGVSFFLAYRLLGKICMHKQIRGFLLTCATIGGVYVIAVSAVMVNRAYFSEPPESGELAVIVLGGKIKGDAPSLMLRRRLDMAYDYMQKNASAVCVVAGGQGPDETMPEAVVMRDYLIERGIGPKRVLLEDKSLNTRQNLEFAASLTPQDYKVVISTDGFHQLRAGMFAKSAGLGAPYALSSPTPWGLLPTYWLREMIGIPVALLMTR